MIGVPDYVKYATYGLDIARAILHSVDSTGLCVVEIALLIYQNYEKILCIIFPGAFYDGDGRANVWWTSETQRRYNEHVKCYMGKLSETEVSF
jgi:hypothetical protein